MEVNWWISIPHLLFLSVYILYVYLLNKSHLFHTTGDNQKQHTITVWKCWRTIQTLQLSDYQLFMGLELTRQKSQRYQCFPRNFSKVVTLGVKNSFLIVFNECRPINVVLMSICFPCDVKQRSCSQKLNKWFEIFEFFFLIFVLENLLVRHSQKFSQAEPRRIETVPWRNQVSSFFCLFFC